MLSIKNLHVKVGEKIILNGVTLGIKPGEIHAVMGPNGSGKSTLANTIMGHPNYKVLSGDILLNKKSILKLKTDERARKGIFLSFQYPQEMPGVSVSSFIGRAVATMSRTRGKTQNPIELRKLLREKLEEFGFEPQFLNRYLNDSFSGGEKKKMELVQMSLLEPSLAILDEPDSGLDLDALQTVAKGIKKSISPKRGILIITHYQRILKYIKPDFIHIMLKGKIVKSGDSKLSRKLERHGYDWLRKEKNSALTIG